MLFSSQRTNILLACLAAVVVIVAIILSPLGMTFRQTIENEFGYETVAVYGACKFIGQGEFYELQWDIGNTGGVGLYLLIEGSGVYQLNAVEKSIAMQTFVAPSVSDAPTTYEVFREGDNKLTYSRRGLVAVRVTHSDSRRIKIGPNKDGPFVSLPISRAKLYEVFGKPDRWDRQYVPGPGP